MRPTRRLPAGEHVLLMLIAIGAVLSPSSPLLAQPRLRLVGPVQQQETAVPDHFAAVLHASEEADTLLGRAEEGAARQDWKLVVDSLQRIVELPGDHILQTNETKYESARQHAHRKLGQLPPEGLRTYRLIHDGQAAALFKQAVERQDQAGLRAIFDRLFLTSYGDDAAITLADWLMDEGRFLEAGILLRRVRDVYPDSDLPAWAVPLRLAVCQAGMGRPERAAAILDQLENQPVEGRVAERIAQVRRFTEEAKAAEPRQLGVGWPMAYGRSSRDGNMSPVEPSFISHLPWNVALPVPHPRAGIGALEEYAAAGQFLPAAEIVTNGRSIVVKSGRNLMALDRDTFDPLWTTRSENEEADLIELEAAGRQSEFNPWPGVNIERSVEERFASDPQVRRLYHDSIGNQVCLAADLAITVEWPGDPPDTLSARKDRGLRRHSMPMAGSSQSHPNFVVAYSMADGQRVWTSDTTAGPEALGPVEFLSVPIVVEGMLLAPGRVNDDLYAVLLDPASGKIARHIYLCGTGGATFDSLYACMPAVADGTVFIPTGRGVLLAIDIANWSIRWAMRYDGVSAPVNEVTWLPTPVMAAADVVLMAPPDADQLFCIDRAGGELLWHAPRESASYVLAAGDGLVWTVGAEVSATDLQSGETVWRTPCNVPAGRGAHSGDRLYLPTHSGLFVLDARTGEPLESRPIETPAGNLLAYEDSLYVASAFEVRKYPDMKRGYDQAMLAWQKNPSDVSVSMRLGWLEYLRGEPAAALTALAQVPEWVRAHDPQRWGRLVHLQLLATLELASATHTDRAEALDLLSKAQQMAATVDDAIKARLALGEFLERDSEPGSLLRACMEYATLAFEPTGDQITGVSSDAHEQRAGLMASRRLADLLPRLSAVEVERLMSVQRKRLAEAIATRNLGQLRRISNCLALRRLAAEADLILAVWACKDLAYEQAEAHLRRVIQKAESPQLMAEAHARLAVIYLQPSELQLPVAAEELLGKLERQWSTAQIPASILEPEWSAPVVPGSAERRIEAAQAARVLRRRIDDRILSVHEEALGKAALGAAGKTPETTAYAGARPIVVRGERVEPLADRMLNFVEDRTVEARRIDDGELLWPAELRLLGEMVVESQTINDAQRFMPRIAPSEPARGLVHGQTLIVNTRFGIHAVGLLTGRRLWSRRFDPPAQSSRTTAAGSDSCIWVHDGYVISVDNYGQLEVAPVESGSDVLWRRRVLDRRWQTVRASGEYLVVGDAGLERVDVFKLTDGTHMGVCEFTQQTEANRAINVAVLDDVICGPVSPREIAAMELKTPGLDPRWKVEMDEDLSQIFKPADNLLAIADRQGGLKLVDPTQGSVILNEQVQACPNGVVDGRIDDGVLYVYGLEKQSEANHVGSERQQWAMAAIRVENGETLWSKSNLGSQLPLATEALTAASNAIPLLVYRPPGYERRVTLAPGIHGQPAGDLSRRAKVELIILDKATGAAIGDSASLEVEGTDGANLLLDLQVWPGRVTAFVGNTHIRFPLLRPGERQPSNSAESGNRGSGGGS